jgi:alkylated DNA repair dioxygenase AlkB
MDLVWQPTMFGDQAFEQVRSEDQVGHGLSGLRRLWLDERSWIDTCAGWFGDHEQLLDELVRIAPWSQRERRMYDRDVLEPRLVAAWSGAALAELPDAVESMRAALSAHYAIKLDSVLVNLYRDGRDGVAWHDDTVRKRLPSAVVVTVGLGERRRFLLRPGDIGPAALELTTGQGDLVVMGGRTQHDWQHTVPKAARAGARMSITMRHSRPLRD